MNFETFMDTLCIELGLPLNSDFDAIVHAVHEAKKQQVAFNYMLKDGDIVSVLDSRRTSR